VSFRLPATLMVGQQYQMASPGDVTALEAYLPASSRVLVGLVFAERYDGFEDDCERADQELRKQAGLSLWPEYPQFVTPDPDGQPIAWVSYVSSPAWWVVILVILGAIFLLPIIGTFSLWVIEKMFPGFMETISMVVGLVVVGGIMFFMSKQMAPAREAK